MKLVVYEAPNLQVTTLEATQGQIDGFFGQLPYKCHQNRLPYKCHQNRVASVGDRLKIRPWVTSRVVSLNNL